MCLSVVDLEQQIAKTNLPEGSVDIWRFGDGPDSSLAGRLLPEKLDALLALLPLGSP